MFKKALDRLEKSLGHLAIPHLVPYIMIVQAGLYLYGLDTGGALNAVLALDGERVVHHLELWRLVTFLFTPPPTSPFWFIFYLFLYIWFASSLEAHWGVFKFNFYYFFGAFCMALFALVFQNIAYSGALNNSLFIAFAAVYPEMEILIYFILPIKVKWLAFLQVGVDIFLFLMVPEIRLSIIAAYLNFFLFFTEEFLAALLFLRRRTAFAGALETARESGEARLFCTVCKADPRLDEKVELRFCTRCQPPRPFCLPHLGGHDHNPENP